MIRNLPAIAGDSKDVGLNQTLCWEEPLEQELATHSGILTWKIPWTEEPGGLQPTWGPKVSDITEQLST